MLTTSTFGTMDNNGRPVYSVSLFLGGVMLDTEFIDEKSSVVDVSETFEKIAFALHAAGVDCGVIEMDDEFAGMYYSDPSVIQFNDAHDLATMLAHEDDEHNAQMSAYFQQR